MEKINDNEFDLDGWFGLSHASFLTLPRVLINAMPKEWQQEMVKLLVEYDQTFPNLFDLETRVQVTRKGKLIKTPEWLLNYQHPDRGKIEELKNNYL